jgi:hypothetical protein
MIWRILAAVFIAHELFIDRSGILANLFYDSLWSETICLFPGIGIQCEQSKLLMTMRSGLIPFRDIACFNLAEGIRGFQHRYVLTAQLRNGQEIPLLNVL